MTLIFKILCSRLFLLAKFCAHGNMMCFLVLHCDRQLHKNVRWSLDRKKCYTKDGYVNDKQLQYNYATFFNFVVVDHFSYTMVLSNKMRYIL